MTPQQYFPGLVHARSQPRRVPAIGMQFLHERATRVGDFFTRGALRKPQDLISFILGHRAPQAATLTPTGPRVAITISCFTPAGKPAVEISLGQQRD